jgi:hypothetical protein
MRIKHPAVKTNVFKLVSVSELDLHLSSELSFPLRVEVFQDTEKRKWFRAHVWELEHFNLQPTFPVKRKGKPLRYKSSELLMLERGTQLTGNYDYFRAKSSTIALAKVVKDLKSRLEHWTCIKAK